MSALQDRWPDPLAAATFAADLASTVVACHHGNQAEAFTALVGATIVAAGRMPDPCAMFDVAIAALVSARSKVLAHLDTQPAEVLS